MNQQFGIFEEEKKCSPDVRFFVENASIMFKYNESIKTTEPIPFPHSKDVTYTVLLIGTSDFEYFCVTFFFLNGANEQKTVTYNVQILNGKANDEVVASKTFSPKILEAKAESCDSMFFLKSSVLKSGDDCDIIVRIEEIKLVKKIFKSDSAIKNQMPDLSTMYQDDTFKDVTFVFGPGASIMAHKTVLATRSKVFHSMFANDMKEKQDGVVMIEDFGMIAFEKFIKYLYTNEIDNLDEGAEDLMMIAEKYDIQCLRGQCENRLCLTMNETNAVDLLIKGDKFNFLGLKQRALFIIKSSIKTTKFPELYRILEIPHLKEEIIELLFDHFDVPNDAVRATVIDATLTALASQFQEQRKCKKTLFILNFYLKNL